MLTNIKQTKARGVSIGFDTWKSLVTFLRQVDRGDSSQLRRVEERTWNEDVEPECARSLLMERSSKMESELEGLGVKGRVFVRWEIEHICWWKEVTKREGWSLDRRVISRKSALEKVRVKSKAQVDGDLACERKECNAGIYWYGFEKVRMFLSDDFYLLSRVWGWVVEGKEGGRRKKRWHHRL